MNLSRLLSVLNKIKDELDRTKIPSSLNNLKNHLEAISRDENNQGAQNNYKQSYNFLTGHLNESIIKEFSNNEIQMLKELKLFEHFGHELLKKLESVLNSNLLTSLKIDELNKINTSFSRRRANLNAIINTFSELGYMPNKLEAGENEIGISLPMSYLKGDLKSLSTEIAKMHKFFHLIKNVVKGDKCQIEVKTLTTSDPTIFIQTSLEIVRVAWIVFKEILGAYEKSLKIKKARKELQDNDSVSEETIKSLQDDEKKIIDETLKEIPKSIEQNIPNFNCSQNKEIDAILTQATKWVEMGAEVSVEFSKISEFKKEINGKVETSKMSDLRIDVNGSKFGSIKQIEGPKDQD